MVIMQAFLYLCLMPVAGDTSFQIDGKAVTFDPPPIIDGDHVFVPLDGYAKAVNLEAKTVVAGKLVVLCRDEWCQPLHLKPADVRRTGGVTAVNLRVLAEATGREFSIIQSDSGRTIVIARNKAGDEDQTGELAPGSMLPDVGLTDVEGNPVRLSDYLGKRLLICTWASW